MLSWLFNQKQEKIVTDEIKKTSFVKPVDNLFEFRHGMFHIKSINFLGRFSESPSKEYVLSWMSGGYESGQPYNARYVLVSKEQIILTGEFERIGTGGIADNGNFVISSFTSDNKPKATFHGFNKEVEKLLRQTVRARLYNNGISPDGNFACCQTCHSDNNDANSLFFFDLSEKKLLWKGSPVGGQPDSYEFDTEKKLLYIIYEKYGRFAYDFSGAFLDKDKWENSYVNKIDGYDLYLFVEKKFKELDEDVTLVKAKEILDLLDKSLKGLTDNYAIASVHRTKGEIFEVLKDYDKAIEYYEQALSFDSKIGVKRKLNSLKKKKV